jgi:hypothetical protein
MEIINQPPPNFSEIKQYFDVEKYKPVFCYGNKIYNPYKHDIPVDIQIHEEVHSKQQAEYSSPDIWWTKYILDQNFRKSQELEAYHTQYLWLKERIPEKGYSEALDEMANNLSMLYNLDINFYQAKTLIRKYNEC